MKTKRLYLTDAISDNRSREFATAIYEAGEIEWYYGVKVKTGIVDEITINRKNFYNIFDENNSFIGYIGVTCFENEAPEVELYILKQYRKSGYAKEVLTMFLSEIFRNGINGKKIEKVVSSVRVENTASRKLMESCGFELNKEIGFCMKVLFDEDDELAGEPIELVHYFITKDLLETFGCVK